VLALTAVSLSPGAVRANDAGQPPSRVSPSDPVRWGPYRVSADTPQTKVTIEHRVHHVHHFPPPPKPVESRAPEVRYTRFASFPYAGGAAGHALRGVAPSDRLPGRLHAGTIAADGGWLGGRQGRGALHLRLVVWRIGLDSTMNAHFSRPLREGPLHVFAVGSTHAVFAPVLRPRVAWWTGVGVNYAAASRAANPAGVGMATGFNLMTSVDVFPIDPLILSARGDFGMLDRQPVVAARATLGAMLDHVEIFAGYEARRVGPSVIAGPLAGVRVWF
jgi:hypothetical protein